MKDQAHMVLLKGTFRNQPVQVHFRRLKQRKKFEGHWRVNVIAGGKSWSGTEICKPCWSVAETIMRRENLVSEAPRVRGKRTKPRAVKRSDRPATIPFRKG